ncbi:PKD domain-containing protein [Methanosarcina sp. UBA5]|uniref:PKD domain-containing protein n=1 Tax=Methanosarcina sp. UBA5 TaxID=1915593 RepID=UPI0025F852EB|nr:PKD domain-containing protein [Methanosarcina sp. UBA5]
MGNLQQQRALHTHNKEGKYTFSLTVKNAAGTNTRTIKDYIVAKELNAHVAAFSASPTSGKAPLTVTFTDKSTGIPTEWKWTFGDGINSTEQSPKHQYLQEGNYTVKLTVSNAAGSSTKTKTNYIKVTTNTRPGLYSKSK